MVASLISVSSARWAQPVISATRIRRSPSAGWVCGRSFGEGGGTRAGRHLQHRPEPRVGHQPREGPAEPGPVQRQPEAARMGQDPRQRPAQHPVHERAAVGALDVGAGVIDEVHVVHARRAGGHAGEAGQAAVDVKHRLGVGRPIVLQHVLDEVDAPAGAVELVAQGDVGRAGRRAEAAVDAGAQDLVRARRLRVAELLGG